MVRDMHLDDTLPLCLTYALASAKSIPSRADLSCTLCGKVTVCEQRWLSGQELLFDAQRVTTIEFSEGGVSL